jgi:hypothetical protein
MMRLCEVGPCRLLLGEAIKGMVKAGPVQAFVNWDVVTGMLGR